QLQHPSLPGQNPSTNACAKALIFHGVLAWLWTGPKLVFLVGAYVLFLRVSRLYPMNPSTHVRCTLCGLAFPSGWLRLANVPNSAMLLHHLGADHLAEV